MKIYCLIFHVEHLELAACCRSGDTNNSGCILAVTLILLCRRVDLRSSTVFAFRDDVDMLEILHTEIMEELDKMEELLRQRLKRFLRSHVYEGEEHQPLSDLISQCILHSVCLVLWIFYLI